MEIKTFKNFINERYVNAFSKEDKEKYKNEVYQLLMQSYASMGGIKGNGFRSPDDMVANIPMWKLARKGNRIIAVALYKDKNGRKAVAYGTDGTPEGKAAASEIFKSEFSRAYFEVSERALSFNVKLLGYDFIKKYAVDPSKVKSITGDDVEYPVPDDDAEVMRHHELKKYFYRRELGGHMHTKILLGTTGKKIVVSENIE